jgi:hypothetical protein
MFSAKIKTFFKPKKILAMFALVILVGVSVTRFAHAQSVTQGYGSDDPLQRGMIVALKDKDPSKVEMLSIDHIDRMMGVVVAANDSPLTISSDNQKVFVATVGRYDVLVDDQNGPIKKNDLITISNVNGIGMKADIAQSLILGRAITGFDGKTGLISSTDLKDSKGGVQKVHIGRIQVEIAISKNPAANTQASIPNFLNKAGRAIAGKTVSPARIYVGLVVFIFGAFMAGAILYSGIKSSIIAIGRNPLSKRSVWKGLLAVVFTALIVFILSLVGVYLLLKL